jgi:hypothetical protein
MAGWLSEARQDKAGRMREAGQGRYSMLGKVNAQCKARQMRNARPGRCAR